MRVPLHLVEERRERLRALIRADGFMPVAEICRKLDVSEATVRRDLAAVSARGEVTRTHGGALADYNASFASHRERATRATSAKGRIAVAAAQRMPKEGTVFLDAGTTIQVVARQMLSRRGDFTGLRVVTNSLPVATVLGGAPGLDLHVLGGTFLHRQAALLGDDAVQSLANWSFDAAFLGGEGFCGEGIFNSQSELAVFQRAVIARTKRVFFCLDATKLGRTTPHRITNWTDRVILITDTGGSQVRDAELPIPAARVVLAR